MKCIIYFLGLATAAFALSGEEYDAALRAIQNPDLYDGDMAGIDGPFDAERNAIPGQQYRWPNRVVPYVIDSTLAQDANLIYRGIKDYHDQTCLRFVPRTTQQDYVDLFYGQGCYSHVGRTGGKQPLSLGSGCLYVGTVIHELGHAIGLYHEQSRSDRDDYLNIYLENVQSGMEFNFQKLPPNQNLLYITFDHSSIMIYGNDAFSKDGSPTMTAKNGQKLFHPFDKQVMTRSDSYRINKMYNC